MLPNDTKTNAYQTDLKCTLGTGVGVVGEWVRNTDCQAHPRTAE